GYDARWCGLRAADVGAPHGRFRVFVVAWPAADSGRETVGLWPGLRAGEPEWFGWRRPDHDGASAPVADASSDGRHQGRTEPARLERRHDAAERGAAAADADRDGLESVGRFGGVRRDADGRDGAREATADADRDTIRQQPVGIVGRVGEAEPGRSRTEAAPDAEHGGRGRRTREPVRSEIGRTTPARDRGSDIAWGPYGPAINRWERTLGRVAPAPTEPGRN